MARRLRIQYSDAIYHVMARGNGRQDIVQDDADRGRLVARGIGASGSGASGHRGPGHRGPGIGVRASGRVDLGGCPPKSPTDPGLHITRHPVPHLMNSRPVRSVVGTWTWFRSRCTCQVSLQRLTRRHPLPLTGSLGLVPPLQRYYEVLRLPAAHFAALRFLRLAIPSLRPWFVPPAPDAEPWINLGLVGGISSRLARWKRQGLPSSRRNPWGGIGVGGHRGQTDLGGHRGQTDLGGHRGGHRGQTDLEFFGGGHRGRGASGSGHRAG